MGKIKSKIFLELFLIIEKNKKKLKVNGNLQNQFSDFVL